LIETLFVLLLLALFCVVAASSLRWVQRKIQIQAAAEDLLNTVLTARTEALRREKRVTVCVAQTLTTQCDKLTVTSGGLAASWQQGWLMFVDDNSNAVWDSGEVLLQQHKALTTDISATGNVTVNRYISFGANGRPLLLNGGFQAGTLTVCEHLALTSAGWQLVINAVGRPRLVTTEVAQCL
jgi:type IV fimbrial biogenesis protein FimT